MAKRLSDQKRTAYACVSKACPFPADFRGFPELQRYVTHEWRVRMEYCRRWRKAPKNQVDSPKK